MPVTTDKCWQQELVELGNWVSYELYAGVVEDADAGGREVGSPQQLVAVEVRAEVGQHRLRPQVLADDVRHVPAVGEAAGGAVRRVVDAVGRRVGACRRGKVVVVAAVHQRVAEDEEGARSGGGLLLLLLAHHH